jgi:hypothetical protein
MSVELRSYNPPVIPLSEMSYKHVFIDQFILARMLLTCIREVPSSNIGQETDIPDRGLSWLPSVPTPFSQFNTGVGPQIWAQPPLFRSLFSIHFTIRLFVATVELLNHKKHIHPALVLSLFAFNPLVNLHYFLICALTFSV